MITQINSQLWVDDHYFLCDQLTYVKDLYRKTRIAMSMQYDNRVLTSWANSPDLQNVVYCECTKISQIVGQKLAPQAAYVSLDLSGSNIMMHRLHPDIYVQVQICLSDIADSKMDFSFCNNLEINQRCSEDYRPSRPITAADVDTVKYSPNTASIYLNNPRGFVGMLGVVPANSVREVLVLSYVRSDNLIKSQSN